ncbi:MAG TPA: SCO family protein [Chitinophagaceae bacterium]
MKKIFLYLSSITLICASCTADKQQVESCCKVPAGKTAQQAPDSVLPGESLYNDTDVFTSQHGKSIQLKDFRGKITVVSMVFTHCTYACPRLTEDIKAIGDKLQAQEITDVNYVLVSFDTNRDDPERLRAFAAEMGLDKRWTLLQGSEDAVRQLSVLLNVQYEKAPDGSFAHSNLITVLDQQGRVATQLEGLEAGNSETVATIQQLAKL